WRVGERRERITDQEGAFSGKAGLSLLEVMVVLIIMLLGMGLYLGINYRQQESLEVRAFASELGRFMGAAGSSAVVNATDNACVYVKADREVVENLKGRSITVPDGARIVLPEDPGAEEFVLAFFYADGSMGVADFFFGIR
ncbi:prepilin-type N-terminal cleavage/methylation domain-containing protein, partial [Desulfonatronospira sp. MSAO_Bac3]|uniref:prepilin-type N-terminal cleavage/methylation domain-containing protein n=1 Tax=Desulfonatronospira sp. MSAO_Bac3 TaxID=2293857 RepID=UPI000FED20EF